MTNFDEHRVQATCSILLHLAPNMTASRVPLQPKTRNTANGGISGFGTAAGVWARLGGCVLAGSPDMRGRPQQIPWPRVLAEIPNSAFPSLAVIPQQGLDGLVPWIVKDRLPCRRRQPAQAQVNGEPVARPQAKRARVGGPHLKVSAGAPLVGSAKDGFGWAAQGWAATTLFFGRAYMDSMQQPLNLVRV